MKVRPVIVTLLLLSFLAVACGKLQGEFALRRYSDDVYRKVSGPFECAAAEEVQWSYVFSKVAKRSDIAVVVQKKEIGWVESRSNLDYIDLEKKVIHGTIKNFEPGEYQIIILRVEKKNEVLERLKFFVYEGSDTGR